ncbi:MAG: SpoIIE family protein phosphatase, partial [Pirellulales bacterium]
LLAARSALAEREAELAAGVPLLLHRSDVASLSDRLTAVLKAGAEVLGGERIAMYLLNESTTALKLRSQWGFEDDKLLEAARPLAGAVADLEALTGSAVALEDDLLNDAWHVPEPCGAAICVPISSPTSILGTLWIYFDASRAISDVDTNSAELTAGRLAAELEREMLWRESLRMAPLCRQATELCEQFEANRRRTPPRFDAWKLAFQVPHGASDPSISALQFDWLALGDDSLLVMLIDGGGTGLADGMHAQQLAAAVRSHAAHVTDLAALMQHASQTLWQVSANEVRLGCTLLRLAADGRSFFSCHAGGMSTLLVTAGDGEPCSAAARPSRHGWHTLSQAAPPAGAFEETEYVQQQHAIEPDQLLVLCSRRIYQPQRPESPLAGEAALVRELANLSTRDPAGIAAEIGRWAMPLAEEADSANALGVLALRARGD